MMLWMPIVVPGHDHVRISNCFNFRHAMLPAQEVELRAHGVQHAHKPMRMEARCHVRIRNDVCKKDRDLQGNKKASGLVTM